jgi:hypothetical protein
MTDYLELIQNSLVVKRSILPTTKLAYASRFFRRVFARLALPLSQLLASVLAVLVGFLAVLFAPLAGMLVACRSS